MRWLASFVAVAITAVWVGAGQAQVVEKKGLTLSAAKQIIATAVGEARRLGAPGAVIAVVDDGGNLVALERLDGTFPAGARSSYCCACRAGTCRSSTARRSWPSSSRAADERCHRIGAHWRDRIRAGRPRAPSRDPRRRRGRP
ncbi:MAG: hypothetical protein DME04_03450 [Candidatus Rokuibacteriota bacterium]|nr:MAG: hypothetical protein DME04_03450 [Candidatus Rokubacteria bacterium]